MSRCIAWRAAALASRPCLRAAVGHTRRAEVHLRTPMTDQELVLSALRQVGLIVAEHLELGMTDADEAITQLVALLDTTELADAIRRLEQGYGLRVVK